MTLSPTPSPSLFRRLAVALAVLLWGTLIACSSGDGPTAPNGTGIVAIRLTDAPTDGLDELDVYITGLSVKPADDSPVVVIESDVGLVDLLALQNTSELLATAGVEPGAYNHIFVDLDEDQSYVIESGTGLQKPLHIASEKIKVLGGFEVDENLQTTVLLDFDAQQSLRQTGQGDWLLVPVIVQAQVTQD